MKVTHDPERLANYLRYLRREIDLLAPRPICDLGPHLRNRFTVASDAEVSIDADPRGLTEEHIAAAREVGVARLSLGV